MIRREVTQLLMSWREGDLEAMEQLLPLVYEELRRQARSYLRRERADHTLQPTALVHEAYLRLADRDHPGWKDRAHFHAVAAQVMRRILVDHARRRGAAKRGGDVVRVPLDDLLDQPAERAAELLALDAALEELTALDPRKGKIIELRFFAGLTIDETAGLLGISAPTVVLETRLARAWLYKEMTAERIDVAS